MDGGHNHGKKEEEKWQLEREQTVIQTTNNNSHQEVP